MTTTKSIKALHDEIIRKVTTESFTDGTYDIETLKPVEFKNGFQVSFYTEGMKLSDEQYDYIVSMFLEFSMDGKTYLGYFWNTPEISFRIADKRTAKRLAKQFNQFSIWNWRKGTDIKTKGTGKAE